MKLERDKQIEDPVQICVADTRRARCVVERCRRAADNKSYDSP